MGVKCFVLTCFSSFPCQHYLKTPKHTSGSMFLDLICNHLCKQNRRNMLISLATDGRSQYSLSRSCHFSPCQFFWGKKKVSESAECFTYVCRLPTMVPREHNEQKVFSNIIPFLFCVGRTGHVFLSLAADFRNICTLIMLC